MVKQLQVDITLKSVSIPVMYMYIVLTKGLTQSAPIVPVEKYQHIQEIAVIVQSLSQWNHFLEYLTVGSAHVFPNQTGSRVHDFGFQVCRMEVPSILLLLPSTIWE